MYVHDETRQGRGRRGEVLGRVLDGERNAINAFEASKSVSRDWVRVSGMGGSAVSVVVALVLGLWLITSIRRPVVGLTRFDESTLCRAARNDGPSNQPPR